MTEPLASILLASGSPRRREILERMGLRFRVESRPVAEWEASEADPAELVEENARRKARAARPEVGELVLAADTTVALGHELLHKPGDLEKARAMLRRLSGRTHEVFTGVCLRWQGEERVFAERSEVTFCTLDEARIARYLSLVNPLDKAGAYGIQEGRELIVAHLAGSLENVMGLPTERLEQQLDEAGWLAFLQRP